jgi:secondary thiamine-phosphate synthase enzyme
MMRLVTSRIRFSTQGNSEIVNLTDTTKEYLKRTNLNSGSVSLFIPGATGGLTTMEYEPALIDDFRQALQRIVPEQRQYLHNLTHADNNAHSHIRASLIGPSLSIPFENATLQLGEWQQIVLIDFDSRPRKREVVLQIIGEE